MPIRKPKDGEGDGVNKLGKDWRRRKVFCIARGCDFRYWKCVSVVKQTLGLEDLDTVVS